VASILNEFPTGFEQGILQPPAIETHPFSRVVEAYEAVERGGGSAKRVLVPASEY
jgi:NADPH:quinone reductase